MHELVHFTDNALLGATAQLSAHDHRTTASLVAHLAEIDARRLYLALGHPSMFAYVVETLHLFRERGLPAHPSRAYGAPVPAAVRARGGGSASPGGHLPAGAAPNG